MKGKVIDGHAPGLSGKGLNAYISAGIRSDHECTTIEEAREKLEKGMYIMLREGTIAKNLKTLLPFITTENSRRFMFVTDDRNPVDIVNEGHINFMVKTAIKWGIDPVTAVRMATLNPAEYFRLNKFGAIAPGYNADFIFFDNLKSFNIKKVFKRGRLVAENGCLIPEIPSENPIHLRCSMNVKPISIDNLKIKVRGRLIKVIEIISGQLITRKKIEKAKIDGEIVVADVDRDILKVAVIERHLSSGNIGIGFVEGFGLKKGAIASSVSHDSHNIITVGTSDRDMMCAVNEIIHLKGGQVVVSGEDIIESFPLPVAGLMSDKSLNEVKDGVERLNFAAKRLGCPLTNPFMSLSFLSLSVIPELKITDKGLIDVEKSKIVPLFER